MTNQIDWDRLLDEGNLDNITKETLYRVGMLRIREHAPETGGLYKIRVNNGYPDPGVVDGELAMVVSSEHTFQYSIGYKRWLFEDIILLCKKKIHRVNGCPIKVWYGRFERVR